VVASEGSVLVWLVFLAVGALTAALTLTTCVALQRRPGAHHGPVHATANVVRHEIRRAEPIRRFLRDRVRIAEATGLALTLALLGLVLVGALAFQVRTESAVVRLDRSVARWAAEHASASSTEALRWFTDLGSTVGVVIIAIVVVVITARRAPWTHVALFALVAIGGANLATNLLKLVVERARPDFGPLNHPSSFSYPSGHSAAAAACFATVAICLGRGRTRSTRTALATVAAALATMVASSRVLLGVHWLSDVLAGLALGAAWVVLSTIAFGGRLLRFGAPVEMAARVEVLDRVPSETHPDRDAGDAEQRAGDGVGQVVHAEEHP
jgi:undecaprenyl-diphosphatase